MTPGNQFLDLVYIDDITNLYELLIKFILNDNNFINNNIFNYDASSNIRYSIKDIINIFELLINNEIKINYGSINYRFREVMNPYLGNQFPGWTCLVDLKKGINNILVHEKLI